MRLRAAAPIVGDFTSDRMPSVEGELADGRDEDRWGVVVADLDLAHEAEGVAGVEHIGHSAAAVRVPAACGRDRCGQRPSARMRREGQELSKRVHQSARLGGACLIGDARIRFSKNIGHIEICLCA
jgi:hypothetical protein